MPEISNNAAILIATSFQALNRAKTHDKATTLCNCTIAILFASFFIEENLDVIIKKMKKDREMEIFLNKRKGEHPGLLDKIGWFYNYSISSHKVDDKNSLFTQKLMGKLEKQFPGFRRIYQFRNNVAHGKINRRISLEDAKKLRMQAKSIVDTLLSTALELGCYIPREVTYTMAIANTNNKQLAEA